MKGSKMTLTFLSYGAKFVWIGIVVAALTACTIVISMSLYALLTPLLQVIWESGWVPLGLAAATVLFIGGGLFGVFIDMDPTIRKSEPHRSHE